MSLNISKDVMNCVIPYLTQDDITNLGMVCKSLRQYSKPAVVMHYKLKDLPNYRIDETKLWLSRSAVSIVEQSSRLTWEATLEKIAPYQDPNPSTWYNYLLKYPLFRNKRDEKVQSVASLKLRLPLRMLIQPDPKTFIWCRRSYFDARGKYLEVIETDGNIKDIPHRKIDKNLIVQDIVKELITRGFLEEARKIANASRTDLGVRCHILHDLVIALANQDRFEEAIDTANTIFDREKRRTQPLEKWCGSDLKYWHDDKVLRNKALRYISDKLIEREDGFDQAFAVVNSMSLASDPDNDGDEKIEALESLAEHLIARHRFKEAFEVGNSITQVENKRGWGHGCLIREKICGELTLLNRLDEALQLANLTPTDKFLALGRICKALAHQDRMEEAIKIYMGISDHWFKTDPLSYICKKLISLNRLDEALALVDRTLESDSNKDWVLRNICEELLSCNQLDKAIGVAAHIVDMTYQDYAIEDIAKALVAQGHFEKAREFAGCLSDHISSGETQDARIEKIFRPMKKAKHD